MEQIIKGTLKPGNKVPSVREYALELKVNPKTIQKAFEYLADKQIFITRVGAGRFITDDNKVLEQIKKEIIANEVQAFITKMQNYNFTKAEIIEKIQGGEYE